jgi:pSer/pThr/pTyr-binding forkhead associated (FHA) protein
MGDTTTAEPSTLVTSEDKLGGFVPYVVIVEGPHHGTRFPLNSGENLIGRAPGTAIMLEDQSVSRQHAVITGREDGWQVKDLGSKNGTFVNGRQIPDSVTLGHSDILQFGIYSLRLVTHQVSIDEEMAPIPADIALETDGNVSEPTGDEAPADEAPATSDEVEVVEGDAGTQAEAHATEEDIGSRGTEMIPAGLEIEEELEAKPQRAWLKWTKVGAGVVLIAGLGTYLALQLTGKPKKMASPPPTSPTASQTTQPPPPPPPPPGPKVQPVFLDFASSPLPARIRFEDKDYGITPVKVNAQLEVGKTYTAEGVFKLEELQEDYSERVNFSAQENQNIIPILFKAPIGVFKIITMPKDVQLYVEGYFSYDQFHPHAAKLTDVPFGKPVYFPYGRYIIELRQSKQIGESQNFVDDIRYRREVFITEDNPNFNFEVLDKDLQVFPVEIRTVPTRADVYMDGQFAGKTPYKGDFPLGEHVMTVRKDGYFEETKSLKVDINTPYLQELTLKTTVAGEFIQKGKLALSKGATQEAINELSEGLKQNPTVHETAQIQYLLGTAYTALGNIPTAQGYFEQAKNDSEVKYPAMLGLVGIYHMQGQNQMALPLLVDVMLNTQDPDVKQQATNAFKSVSPLRSVMYIYSDPAGATVSVNDQALPQRTPIILPDLGIGNYRLKIHKEGFVPQELKIDISVNEFNPIIVKLKPIEK